MTARFGVFELDPRSGELRREGVRVPLQDQPLRLLSILVERAGEIVTREELREKLWGSEFVDFEHGLNTAVRKLRTALGDSADTPQYVETLARRGYRFIASVTREPEPAAPARPRGRLIIPLATAVAIVVAAALLAMTLRPAPDPDIWSIAVLPFTYGNDPRIEPIGTGLTEVLIDTLSRMTDVRVMASTTVFRYKGRSVDPRKIAEELKVGAVVVGDIRRQGDEYRILVEMIHADDGSQLWGDRVVVPADELAAAQSRITDALIQHVRQDRRGPGAYTENAEAYELYLKGLHAWNQRTKQNVRESVAYFTRATELDPNFAAAYAGLAHAWGVMVGNGLVAPAEASPKILAAAERALALDPGSAEAYTSIATTKFRNVWDFEGAERDYRRALALNPNYPTAHQWYADFLRAMGRFGEARREIDLAYKLDPLSRPIHGAKCWSLTQERRYREAIEFARRAMELDPGFNPIPCLSEAYTALGDYETIVIGLEQESNEAARELVAAYRRGGVHGLLTARLHTMLEHPGREYRYPVEIAEAYARMGNKEEAFRWLDIAREQRVSRITSFHLQQGFDSLRSDARFDDLLKRIGLPRVDPPVTADTQSMRPSSGSPGRS